MEAINEQLDELKKTITLEFNKIYEEIQDKKKKEIGEEYLREDSLYRIPGNLPIGPGAGLFMGDWERVKGGTSKRNKSKRNKSKRKRK